MTNSFWREAMDHIPGLVLLFRLDADEQAQLVFVSNPVRGELGFSPEEFVLASETDGSSVQLDIRQMVDDIAAKSRAEGATSTLTCRFRTRLASGLDFAARYRIFRTKSSPHPFILVRLDPVAEPAATSSTRGNETAPKASEFFATESALMKALLGRLEMAASRPVHLLFRGEPGSGRATLARKVLDSEKLSGAGCLCWEKPEAGATHDSSVVQTLDAYSPELADGKVVLLIEEFDRSTPEQQQAVLGWVRRREEMQCTTRVLATASRPLEELLSQGLFDTETYYYLAFETLLVPPLSQRGEDVAWMVREWLERAGRLPGVDLVELDATVENQFASYEWPGNFTEFYEAMRCLFSHLLGKKADTFRWPATTKDDRPAWAAWSVEHDDAKKKEHHGAGGIPKEAIGFNGDYADILFPQGDIRTFDDMNRWYLKKVLERTSGKIYGEDGAARLLGMKPTTLQSKLKKLGVR